MSILTVCPNIDLNLQHKEVKLVSSPGVTFKPWISTSYSNTSASFSMPPPSQQVYIDRCMMKKTPIVVTYGGTTTGSALLQSGYDAPRAYPIACITASDQLTINNQQFVIQTSELVPYMARFWKQSKFSGFPSYMDNYQVYADGAAANNNPLGAYFNAIDHHQPRGGFPMVITNGATASTITMDVYEPIWAPCLHRDFDDGLGFTNVRTCDLVSNYNTNLARIVCHALSLATLTSVTVAVGQPIVYMKYSSPPEGYVPHSITYGSEDLNRFITPLGSALTSNSSTIITSTNMQLNAIPKWILVFCRESNANLTYASTDTATNISNVSINFNNVSGILSSASESQLYSISAENGLQDTWEQWHGVTSNLATQVGTTGSFLKLFFGKDIALLPGTYPGQVGAFNLSMNVTVKNVNQSASITAPILYVITSVHQKLIFHEGGQIEAVLGITDQNDGVYMPYNSAMKHYGGSFRSFATKVSKFFKPLVDFLKKSKMVSTIGNALGSMGVPFASQIGSTAQRLGFGEGGMAVAGRRPRGRAVRGRGDGEGGMIASREELLDRIRSYDE